MTTSKELCAQIHKSLETLPTFKDPARVPFSNGLYFFYQKGETSTHAPNGRLVRIGNHPHSQNGLKRRLRLHYSGNKNGSVLRKYLGGAILRKNDSNHPCLAPGPGQGHWEKQHLYPCPKCKPIENEVSRLLRSDFWFRCVEIEDQNLRNTLEKELVATISLCPTCKPSDTWLGKFAYSENVKNSGLWNSDHVFDRRLTINPIEVETLEKLITSTMRLFPKKEENEAYK